MKTKFSVGQKIYYKHTSKIRSSTIKKIIIEISKNGSNVYYLARGVLPYSTSYRTDIKYSEKQIFKTKEGAAKITFSEKTKKIKRNISSIKRLILKNKNTIKVNNKRLNEIKKEELIERLAKI